MKYERTGSAVVYYTFIVAKKVSLKVTKQHKCFANSIES